MKRLPIWLSFAVTFILAAGMFSPATAQTQAPTAPATQAAAPKQPCPTNTDHIKFGASVSLTGSMSHEGDDTLKGYQLWADWVNTEYGGIKVGSDRHCVDLVYYDDESKAETAAVLTEKLITEDKAQFILGPYSSGLTQSASVITERYGVIMVEGNGAAESIFNRGFKYVFGVLTPGMEYTQAAIESAYKLGARSVVIAYEDTAFPTSVANGAKKWAESLGMKVLGFERYPPNVTDLTAMFTRFRDAKPDIFVGGGHFNDAVVFIKTAKALNFSPSAFIMTVGPSNSEYVKELGADSEYVWGATQWEASMSWKDDYFGTASDYGKRFQAKYNRPANYQDAESTAAALVLQLAIEKAGTLDTDTVRDTLAKTDITTFYGPVKFDASGMNTAKPMGADQIQKGQILPVAPESIAAATPIYPAPAWDKR